MSTNYRTFVVINPAAGSHSVAGAWQNIVHKLRRKLPELDFSLTESVGHATEITRQALRDGWEQIISIGGDGTNNEVLNGFFAPLNRKLHFQEDFLTYKEPITPPKPINPNAILGFIPFGTGGDFRRSIKIGTNLDENIDRLLGQNYRTIDIGEAAYLDHNASIATRLFLNIAGGGFSGRVVELANKTWKQIGRGITFKLVSTIGWLTWTNPLVQIKIDGELQAPSKVFNLAVANGEYFGGGMHMAKGASLTDGLFDVVTCGDFSRIDSFSLMFRVFDAKHFSMKHVTKTQGQHVQARSTDPNRVVLIDIDGEDLGAFPATFTSHHKILNIKI